MKFLLFLISSFAFADYAWLAKEKTFFLRVGWELSSSDANFNSLGTAVPIVFQSQNVQVETRRLAAELEYGIAKHWSFGIRGATQQAEINPLGGGPYLLSNASLGDIEVNLKHSLLEGPLLLTAEMNMKIPPYITNVQNGEIMAGMGTFETGFYLHGGKKTGQFFFALSPGINFRFGGAATELDVLGGVGFVSKPMYAFVFWQWQKPFFQSLLFDSGIDSHDTTGTGGSYTRLAGSPETLDIGGKIGVVLFKGHGLEFSLSKTIAGNRAADVLFIKANMRFNIDFSSEDNRKKIFEVPFDSDEPEEI